MPNQTFVTARQTRPDPATLMTQLQALDPTLVVADTNALLPSVTFWQTGDWTPARITDVQNVLDTCAAMTPQSTAQSRIDQWPIEIRALLLALLDQLNVLRTRAGLAAITPAQALQGVRDKAATLN